MTPEKAELLKRMKIKRVHFAWDRYEEKETVIPKFEEFKEITGWDHRKMCVYVLCNYDTTLEQDLERIYTLRELGYGPYVMIYDKEHVKKTSPYKKLQKWVNSRTAFSAVRDFKDFK